MMAKWAIPPDRAALAASAPPVSEDEALGMAIYGIASPVDCAAAVRAAGWGPIPLAAGDGAEIERLRAEVERLREALTDMRAGWRYIRLAYGDLGGVGWDRCEQSATAALGSAS